MCYRISTYHTFHPRYGVPKIHINKSTRRIFFLLIFGLCPQFPTKSSQDLCHLLSDPGTLYPHEVTQGGFLDNLRIETCFQGKQPCEWMTGCFSPIP